MPKIVGRSWGRPLAACAVAGLVLTAVAPIAVAAELPAPSLSRSATPDGAIQVGQSVDLDLTARNAGSGTAFDPWVVECVSAGLIVSAITPDATVTDAGCADGGTRIDWALDDLGPGATTPLRYTVIPQSLTVAGTMFATQGRLSVLTAPFDREQAGSPLPQGITERTIQSARSLTYGLPAVTQEISPQNPAPGELVTITIRATVPAGVGLGNAVVRDIFPIGFDLARLSTRQVSCVDSAGAACTLRDTADEHHLNHQRMATWNIGQLSPAEVDREITVVLSVPVDAGVDAVLRNRSGMQWSDDPSIVGRAGLRGGATAAATIVVVDPSGPTAPASPGPTGPSPTGPTTPDVTATPSAGPTGPATGTSLPSVPPSEQVSASDPPTSGDSASVPSIPGRSPAVTAPLPSGISDGASASSATVSLTTASPTTASPATNLAGWGSVGGSGSAAGGSRSTYDVLASTGADVGVRTALGLTLLAAGGALAVGLRSSRRPAAHR